MMSLRALHGRCPAELRARQISPFIGSLERGRFIHVNRDARGATAEVTRGKQQIGPSYGKGKDAGGAADAAQLVGSEQHERDLSW